MRPFKRGFSLLVTCVISILFALPLQGNEKSIVVVIPSFNNREWYKLNLDSIFMQNYQNYRVIYIDDRSEDGTGELVAQYIRERDLQDRIQLIQNQERVGALENIYNAIWTCQPDEIVVNVDGDDWLYTENVFQTLNALYSDSDVWMTYGQYIDFPSDTVGHCREVPIEIVSQNRFRGYPWVTSHLRTYYAGLFQKIAKEDLLYEGKFLTVAWDLAFMYPMLEMSGTRSRFVPEILYVYNQATPFNDHKLRREMQIFFAGFIERKQPYQKLESL